MDRLVALERKERGYLIRRPERPLARRPGVAVVSLYCVRHAPLTFFPNRPIFSSKDVDPVAGTREDAEG